MTGRSQPLWPLPLLATAQMSVGVVLFVPLTELAEWPGLAEALLDSIVVASGLAMLGLAVRNSVRIWHPRDGDAARTLVGAIVVAAVLNACLATGPLTAGEWSWWTLVPFVHLTYLLVVLVHTLIERRTRAADPRTAEARSS